VAVAALAAATVWAALRSDAGGGSKASASSGRYGGIPSWLPKATIPVDRIAAASTAHPWLAIEGDTVSVRLPSGRALVTAVGPAVPEEGRFPVPATTRCTFTVTFTSASGALPLSGAAFTVVDELGGLHHLVVRDMKAGASPAFVRAGRSVSLTMTAVLPTGNGQLRWAPVGSKPVVSWDFDVEID